MTPDMLTFGMFGLLLLLIMLGVSLAFALGAVAVVFTLLLSGPMGLFQIVAVVFSTMWSFLLVAVPFFVFMGIALARSKLSADLYQAFYVWSGRVNGGLLMGTAGFAAALAAMTGVAAAATLTTGKVGMPAMERHGYNRSFVMGTIGAAGTLGILIPPSIPLIVIALTTGASIGRLFMGGLIAGLLLLFVIILYVAVRSWLQPDLAPSLGRSPPLREKLSALRSVVVPLAIILCVLFSIFAGIATPTEAAAVGAVAVFLAVAFRGEVNLQFIRDVSYETAVTTGMVIWIVFGASAFVAVYTSGGGVSFMRNLLLGADVSPLLMIILIQLIVLVLGMFLDPLGIILLLMPIFYPVVVQLGFDPIWFAIIFQLNLCIGYITPPFGYNIFYLKSLSPTTPITEIYRAVMPLVLLMIGVGVLLLAFPGIIVEGTRWLM